MEKNNKETNIAIFLPNLCMGGAERMHIELAREWSSKGLKITFVLCLADGELISEIPNSVDVYDLKVRNFRYAIVPLVKYLKQKKPHAVIAAMWPLTFLMPIAKIISCYQGIVLISEHEPLAIIVNRFGIVKKNLQRFMMCIGYHLANIRVGVSNGVVGDMAKLSCMNRSKFKVIYNPAATGRSELMNNSAVNIKYLNQINILTVGTLSAAKRHDLLINAFSMLKITNTVLYIIGEGPQREYLEALIAKLQLQNRVFLMGFVSDPNPWYLKANLFVLSSDYEGFGNVIVEALEHGVPVVSTDCPYGPREILEDGKYGKLVRMNNVEELANTISESIEEINKNIIDREFLRSRAKNFSVQKSANLYLNAIREGQLKKVNE